MKKQQSNKRLTELELEIEINQRNFYSVGNALKEIRDNRLYRKLQFITFEDYTKKRWDMRKSHTYRLINACQVIDNLSPIGEVLPGNESQVRPLIKLEPFNQRKVWREFLKTGMELKARNISKFVSSYMNKFIKNSSSIKSIEVISEEYMKVVEAMLNQIRIAQNDRWESTSQEVALYWNNVMKEKILWKWKK